MSNRTAPAPTVVAEHHGNAMVFWASDQQTHGVTRAGGFLPPPRGPRGAAGTAAAAGRFGTIVGMSQPAPTTPRTGDSTHGTAAPVVRPGAPGWLRATVALGRRIDAAAWSPTSLGDRARDSVSRRRRAAAERDPEWAAIEARRDTGRGGAKTLLSDDLNWGHLETQLEIGERLVPDPWWMRVTEAAREWRFAALAAELVAAVDRVCRGWDNADAYNLSSTLPVRIGEQLAWLAENHHAWPGEHNGYATPEEWEAELRQHARVLTTAGYGHPALADDLLDAWSDAQRIADRGNDPDDAARAEAAWTQLQAAEVAAQDAVTDSMRWVAEHIHLLWD